MVLHTRHPTHSQRGSSVTGFLLFPLGPAALCTAWTPNGSCWNYQAPQAALRVLREKRKWPSRERRALALLLLTNRTPYRSLWIWLSTATAALLTGDPTLLRPLLLPEVSGTGWSHVKNRIIRFLPSPCLEIPLLHWHGYFSRQPWPSDNPNVQKSVFTVNKE